MRCQYQHPPWRTGFFAQTVHHINKYPVESAGLRADADFLFAIGDASQELDAGRRYSHAGGEIDPENRYFRQHTQS
ncbi:MAG: hypothetical protein AAF579_18940 [Cyanobacteria bacterium P01_C01_bin.118]